MKARRDQCFFARREQFVSRDLLENEAVVWFVRVEAVDDVVAIAPRMRPV